MIQYLNFLDPKTKRLWLWALPIKLLLAMILPLSLDESYYWVWSHNLQLSYFDHPPFVSWLYLIGQPLEPLMQAVRWPGVLMGHATILIWLKITEPHFSFRQQYWFLLLLLFMPLTGFGSLVITPDIPLMFFWALATLFFIRSMETGGWKNYLILGAVLGLGFTSKYHVAIYLPFALICLYLSKKFQKKDILPFIGGFTLFWLFALPVLIWNYQNDWISFRFQFDHGLKGGDWKPEWTSTYVIGQLLLLFPTVIFMALKTVSVRKMADHVFWCFVIFSFGPLLFFLYSSTKAYVEPNWPIIAVPFVLALACHSHQARSLWAKSALTFWIFISGVALADTFLKAIPGKPGQVKTQEFYYYENVTSYVQLYPERTFYARTFQMASKLSYELKTFIPKLKGANRFDFYDMHPESTPTKDQIFLILKKGEDIPKGSRQFNYSIVGRDSIDDVFEAVELKKQ